MALVKRKKNTIEAADSESFLPNALRIAELCSEKKAKEIRLYDVRGLTLVADAFVICTATSEPQLKAIFNSVKDGMEDIKVKALRTEGGFQGGWLLIDYGDIIVHIFREESRTFFDLDGMWADAKVIPFDDGSKKPAKAAPTDAG